MLANGVPAPVLEKLKSDPNNFDLLAQAGTAEMKAGDPKSAVIYYDRALKVKDDLETRTSLANAYFRSGDADQSLAELAKVLEADPKNDKALYNTGVVKLMGKNDPKGAIAAWETLLKYYPNHPNKAQVREMIHKVKASIKG
jgi:tetratricopeptide (TPR) repeat protein